MEHRQSDPECNITYQFVVQTTIFHIYINELKLRIGIHFSKNLVAQTNYFFFVFFEVSGQFWYILN